MADESTVMYALQWLSESGLLHELAAEVGKAMAAEQVRIADEAEWEVMSTKYGESPGPGWEPYAEPGDLTMWRRRVPGRVPNGE